MSSATRETNAPGDGANGVSILDLVIVLAKYKKSILTLPLVVAILASGIALSLPDTFTATTKVLPPQKGMSAAAMMAQLGGLADAAGSAAGLKNPADLYVGMFRSRSVADNLIQRFGLNKVYEKEFQSQARKELEKRTAISTGKDSIIMLEVDDQDPQRAADIANAYVEELFKLSKTLAVTEAAQRRLFFEKQFEQAGENLVAAETAAREGMNQSGLIKVDEQGRSLVETTARLRSAATVKEVQIAAMRSYAAERNPQLLAAQQELGAIRTELSKIEGLGNEQLSESSKSPQGMKTLGLLRTLKYHEAVYELMAKQFEAAKIDESKDPSFIQVVDRAIVPDRKSRPKRALIVIVAALAAGVLAVVLCIYPGGVEEIPSKSRCGCSACSA